MRTWAAALTIGLAAVLGTLVGAVALPDRDVPGAGRPSTAVSTTPDPSTPSPPGPSTPGASPAVSPTPTGDPGPVTVADLLTTSDFQDVGLTVSPVRSDVRLELVGCDKLDTLDDVAQSGPPTQQRWEAGSIMATQQAITARTEDEATLVARKVLTALEDCQMDLPGHWVYGPTHTDRLGPSSTASWLGSVDGELNTTGRAPKGEKINGGVAVIRSGLRVAIFDLDFCTAAGDGPACVVAPDGSYDQLAELSRTAALRLS